VGWLGERPPSRVLDIGCADGFVAADLRRLGHHVTGLDLTARPGVKECVDQFVEADLDQGLPPAVTDTTFDVVLAADVLEHVRDPESLLRDLHDVLAPGGRLLVSVPNFGHWYPRLRVVSGRFDYDRRGILDRGHVRFFTRRSFARVLHRSGWHVLRQEVTGLPFDVADRGVEPAGSGGGLAARLRATVGQVDALGVRLRPTLFGYQLLYELEPAIGRVP
jgi:methionine biosynthesis protein MetW